MSEALGLSSSIIKEENQEKKRIIHSNNFYEYRWKNPQ
jgi:hypothetical protein